MTMTPDDGTKYTNHLPPFCNDELEIIYSDDEIVVVDKPAGLLSVPGRILKDSVFQRLLYEYADLSVVHRLDLDTSGLMVLTTSKEAVSDLNRQFREQRVSKLYEALVYGEMIDEEGEIRLPISPDPDNRPLQLIDPENGKLSLTRFTLEEKHDGYSRLTLKPVTGRSHQLRIHLSGIGFPILGCDLYAHQAAYEARSRLCLHSKSLSFWHPVTKKRIDFCSSVPF